MQSIDRLIDLALGEDIGTGDITTDALIDPLLEGKATVIAKEPLILAGVHVAESVFKRFDPQIDMCPVHNDGATVSTGEIVLSVTGKLHVLLKAERTALNFMQRLSGIATHVRSFADLLQNRPVKLVDTRKTTPGWRALEKYAVRIGGAFNHRFGLFDGVLIKDNHIAVCGGIGDAVAAVRKKISHLIKIEVEVTNRSEVQEALTAGADVIMLDNMDLSQIKEALSLIDGRALVEVSGGVTRDHLVPLADLGVDIISVGSLTHGARSVDMSMRIMHNG